MRTKLHSTSQGVDIWKPSCRFWTRPSTSDCQKVLKDPSLCVVAAVRGTANGGNGNNPGGNGGNGGAGTGGNGNNPGGAGTGGNARGTNNAGPITNNGNNGRATNTQTIQGGNGTGGTAAGTAPAAGVAGAAGAVAMLAIALEEVEAWWVQSLELLHNTHLLSYCMIHNLPMYFEYFEICHNALTDRGLLQQCQQSYWP